MSEVSKWYNPIDTTIDGKVKGIPIGNSVIKVGIPCAVCGKFVELNDWGARHATFQLCNECIKAIKWAKIQMKTPHIINVTEDDGK